MQALLIGPSNSLPIRVLTFEDRNEAERLLEAAGFERHGLIPNRWFGRFNWRKVLHDGHNVPACDAWDAHFVEIEQLTEKTLPREGVVAIEF